MGTGWSAANAQSTGARAAARGTASAAVWCARLELQLLEGDERAAWAVIERALDAGHDVASCHIDLVAGALGSLAGRRARGEIDDAQLPLATSLAQRLVGRLGNRIAVTGESRGTVLLGAPAGERHGLPLTIVANLIRLRGFDVVELGSDLPAAAFAAAVVRVPRLVAVGIGVTGIEHIDAARDAVAAIRRVDQIVPVIAGGQAVLSPEIARVVGATAWAASGRDAAMLLDRLATAPSR